MPIKPNQTNKSLPRTPDGWIDWEAMGYAPAPRPSGAYTDPFAAPPEPKPAKEEEPTPGTGAQILAGTAQMFAGLGGALRGATGITDADDSFLNDYISFHQAYAGSVKQPEGYGLGSIGLKVARGAPSLLPSLFTGVTTAGLGTPLALGAMSLTAGSQSYGGTIDEAEQAYYEEAMRSGADANTARRHARGRAQAPAIISGLSTAIITGAFGTGSAGGVEKAFRQLGLGAKGALKGSIKKTAQEKIKKEASKGALRAGVHGGFWEGIEEGSDEIAQSIITHHSYNPEYGIEQATTAVLDAFIVGGALGVPFSGISQAIHNNTIEKLKKETAEAGAPMTASAAAKVVQASEPGEPESDSERINDLNKRVANAYLNLSQAEPDSDEYRNAENELKFAQTMLEAALATPDSHPQTGRTTGQPAGPEWEIKSPEERIESEEAEARELAKAPPEEGVSREATGRALLDAAEDVWIEEQAGQPVEELDQQSLTVWRQAFAAFKKELMPKPVQGKPAEPTTTVEEEDYVKWWGREGLEWENEGTQALAESRGLTKQDIHSTDQKTITMDNLVAHIKRTALEAQDILNRGTFRGKKLTKAQKETLTQQAADLDPKITKNFEQKIKDENVVLTESDEGVGPVPLTIKGRPSTTDVLHGDKAGAPPDPATGLLRGRRLYKVKGVVMNWLRERRESQDFATREEAEAERKKDTRYGKTRNISKRPDGTYRLHAGNVKSEHETQEVTEFFSTEQEAKDFINKTQWKGQAPTPSLESKSKEPATKKPVVSRSTWEGEIDGQTYTIEQRKNDEGGEGWFVIDGRGNRQTLSDAKDIESAVAELNRNLIEESERVFRSEGFTRTKQIKADKIRKEREKKEEARIAKVRPKVTTVKGAQSQDVETLNEVANLVAYKIAESDGDTTPPFSGVKVTEVRQMEGDGNAIEIRLDEPGVIFVDAAKLREDTDEGLNTVHRLVEHELHHLADIETAMSLETVNSPEEVNEYFAGIYRSFKNTAPDLVGKVDELLPNAGPNIKGLELLRMATEKIKDNITTESEIGTRGSKTYQYIQSYLNKLLEKHGTFDEMPPAIRWHAKARETMLQKKGGRILSKQQADKYIDILKDENSEEHAKQDAVAKLTSGGHEAAALKHGEKMTGRAVTALVNHVKDAALLQSTVVTGQATHDAKTKPKTRKAAKKKEKAPTKTGPVEGDLAAFRESRGIQKKYTTTAAAPRASQHAQENPEWTVGPAKDEWVITHGDPETDASSSSFIVKYSKKEQQWMLLGTGRFIVRNELERRTNADGEIEEVPVSSTSDLEFNRIDGKPIGKNAKEAAQRIAELASSTETLFDRVLKMVDNYVGRLNTNGLQITEKGGAAITYKFISTDKGPQVAAVSAESSRLVPKRTKIKGAHASRSTRELEARIVREGIPLSKNPIRMLTPLELEQIRDFVFKQVIKDGANWVNNPNKDNDAFLKSTRGKFSYSEYLYGERGINQRVNKELSRMHGRKGKKGEPIFLTSYDSIVDNEAGFEQQFGQALQEGLAKHEEDIGATVTEGKDTLRKQPGLQVRYLINFKEMGNFIDNHLDTREERARWDLPKNLPKNAIGNLLRRIYVYGETLTDIHNYSSMAGEFPLNKNPSIPLLSRMRTAGEAILKRTGDADKFFKKFEVEPKTSRQQAEDAIAQSEAKGHTTTAAAPRASQHARTGRDEEVENDLMAEWLLASSEVTSREDSKESRSALGVWDLMPEKESERTGFAEWYIDTKMGGDLIKAWREMSNAIPMEHKMVVMAMLVDRSFKPGLRQLRQEILPHLTSAKSESGESLQANVQVNRMLDPWKMALAYEGLLKLRYAEVLEPKFGKNFGEHVIKDLWDYALEAMHAVNAKDWDAAAALIQKAVGKTAEEQKINLKEIFEQSIRTQDTSFESIRDMLLHKTKLADVRGGQEVADRVAEMIWKAWNKKHMDVFRREFARKVALPTITQADKVALENIVPELIRLGNIGLLNEASFWNALAPEYNLPQFDSELAQKFVDMGQTAQGVPEGVRRNRIYQDMLNLLADSGSFGATDVIRDYWYASVLSGLRTHVDVLTGSGINGALMSVQAAIDVGLNSKTSGAAWNTFSAFLNGVRAAIPEAVDILKTGDYSRLPDATQRFLSNIEGGRVDTLESLGRQGKSLGVMKYTRRIMTALDYIGALGTREAMIAHSSYLAGDEAVVALGKKYDEAESSRAVEQARKELEADEKLTGIAFKEVDVNARAREILERDIDKEVLLNATEMGRVAALNADPVGFMGKIYNLLGKSFITRYGLGFAFLRAAANMAQNASNYIPVVGAANWARTSEKAKYVDTLMKGGVGFHVDVHPERARLILAQQLTGWVGMFALWALLDDDEEENDFEVSGAWHGVTPAEKKQLMAQGERPLSFKLGGRWISYKNTPVAGMLAMVGYGRDKKRFDADNYDEASTLQRMSYSLVAGITYAKDVSAMSQFANLFNQGATSDIDEKSVYKQTSAFLQPVFGFAPSILKEVDAWWDDRYWRPESGAEYLLRNLPFFRKTVGTGPAINALGEEISVKRLPWSRWVKDKPDSEVWEVVSRFANVGVFLPTPSRTASLIRKDKQGRPVRDRMTDLEYYKYAKKAGELMKERIETDLDVVRQYTPEQMRRYLDNISKSSRRRARAIIQRSIL